MSRSRRTSRVELSSINPAVQFRLVDQRQQIVAHGEGSLSKKVSPGIYRLEIDSGPVVERQLISLEDGESYEDLNVNVAIPTAAPIEGTSTWIEEHGQSAQDLSMAPTQSLGSGGRLMVFVRSVADDGAPEPIDLSGMSVATGDDEIPLSDGVQGESWGGVCIDLAPGGYRLIRRDDRGAFAQSIWVSKGWATYAFESQHALEGRSNRYFAAHMGPLEAPYEPRLYDESQSRLTAEIVLSGLRRGEVLVPDDLMRAMLNEKFVNPFLGILGAHALLSGRPPWSTFDIVLRNLRKLIPGHPDVTSLFVIGKSMRDNDADTRGEPVAWPPMLYTAYQGLIERNLVEADIIAADSMAEHAASRLVPEGPWTNWRVAESETEDEDRFGRFVDARSSILSDETLDRVGSMVAQAGDWVDVEADIDISYDPAAVEQVARYVTEFAVAQEETFDPSQIAAQVRLPQSAVKKAIKALDDSAFTDRFR